MSYTAHFFALILPRKVQYTASNCLFISYNCVGEKLSNTQNSWIVVSTRKASRTPLIGPLTFNPLFTPFYASILSQPSHHLFYYHVQYHYSHEKSCSNNFHGLPNPLSTNIRKPWPANGPKAPLEAFTGSEINNYNNQTCDFWGIYVIVYWASNPFMVKS